MEAGEASVLFIVVRNVSILLLGLVLSYLVPKLAAAGIFCAYRDHLRAMAQFIEDANHNKRF